MERAIEALKETTLDSLKPTQDDFDPISSFSQGQSPDQSQAGPDSQISSFSQINTQGRSIDADSQRQDNNTAQVECKPQSAAHYSKYSNAATSWKRFREQEGNKMIGCSASVDQDPAVLEARQYYEDIKWLQVSSMGRCA